MTVSPRENVLGPAKDAEAMYAAILVVQWIDRNLADLELIKYIIEDAIEKWRRDRSAPIQSFVEDYCANVEDSAPEGIDLGTVWLRHARSLAPLLAS
jgi:hypothetical protein